MDKGERWKWRPRKKNGDGSSKGSRRLKMFHVFVDRFCDQLFLIAEQNVLSNGSDLATTKRVKQVARSGGK